MSKDHIEKHVRNQISKFNIPFDIEEAKKSNILITGTNSMGKSRLACGIASILQNFDWRIVAFDPVGNYRTISDIPRFYEVSQQNLDLETKTVRYPFFRRSSIIYDTSSLLPNEQLFFTNEVLRDLWDYSRYSRQWVLVLLEEFQLYGRNLRGFMGQNLLRVCSAGRNRKLRILGVTTDLSLIDPSLIRLCGQRYHARLGIEDNAKRKFRGYYGTDWTRIAIELSLGTFIYLNKERLRIISVPCFETKRLPRPFHIPTPRQVKPKGLLQGIMDWIK